MKQLTTLFLLCFSASLLATPAPDFTVTTSDNQVLKLYQNFVSQGKVLVIEAFFTTCPPCNTHAPLMQNLYTQLQAQYPGKVEFLLLSTLGSDSNVKVAQYKTSKSLTMPAAGNDGGSITALQPYTSGQFGQFLGTPTFIVIAPTTGEVHFDIRGGTASQTMTLLSEKIAELLPAPPCQLQDFFGNNLANVQIQVNSATFDTSFNANGSYSIKNIPALSGQNAIIKPVLNDNPLDGVTTYDLVQITKHILGIQAFLCDWQALAADVNCSGTITTLDVVTARKVILGILNEFPCGSSHRFVPDSAQSTSGVCHDFLGVKIGDVYGNPCVQASGPAEERGFLSLTGSNRMVKAGEKLEIAIRTSAPVDLDGLQVTLGILPDQLIINKLSSTRLPEFDADVYNAARQKDGAIPVSWVYGPGLQLAPGETVFVIHATALTAGRLSDMLSIDGGQGLIPEVYETSGAIRRLQLEWTSLEPGIGIFPNPAEREFHLSVQLEQAEDCLIQLYDTRGLLVFEQRMTGIQGLNEWDVNPPALSPGIYYLRMNGEVSGKVAVGGSR